MLQVLSIFLLCILHFLKTEILIKRTRCQLCRSLVVQVGDVSVCYCETRRDQIPARGAGSEGDGEEEAQETPRA